MDVPYLRFERWDTANLHETKNNSGRLTASVAGKYYIFANITWESPIGSGLWGLRLRVKGKTVIAEQSLPNTGAPFRISMSVGTLYALASHFPSAEAFPDCILLDIQLSGMSGFELEDRLASFGSTIPAIFITAHDDPEAIEQARQTGCIAYLRKNDPGEMVLEAIRRAVKRVE